MDEFSKKIGEKKREVSAPKKLGKNKREVSAPMMFS
jgi:hypothetical protein